MFLIRTAEEIGRIVKNLRGEMSLRTFASKCKISHTTLDNIEKGIDFRTGKPTSPSVITLQNIADAAGVKLSYILGNEPEITISNLRPVAKKRFPMLGEIACGTPIFASEDHESYIDASANIDADFCLTAKGDSMIGARIYDGDIVFIKQQPIVNNGEIAAVVIDDEATLKVWNYYPEENRLVLTAENRAYQPLVYTGTALDTIVCLGKAVCFMSSL